MLELAARTLGPLIKRVELFHGRLRRACWSFRRRNIPLLRLQVLNADERVRSVRAIRERLRPDATFVAAHGSFPQRQNDERALWAVALRLVCAGVGSRP